MSSNGHVQLRDYSDRELLAILLDLGGSVTALDLGNRIFGWSERRGEDEQKHNTRCCTARLAWMRRFGLVAKGEQKGEWGISEEGRALISNRIQENVRLAIHRAPDHRTLDLANVVGERMHAAGQTARTAIRRELQFQITRGKR